MDVSERNQHIVYFHLAYGGVIVSARSAPEPLPDQRLFRGRQFFVQVCGQMLQFFLPPKKNYDEHELHCNDRARCEKQFVLAQLKHLRDAVTQSVCDALGKFCPRNMQEF